MSNKVKVLPPRRYYSFVDAVAHLNDEGMKCTLSDLLHFAATNAFEPLVYFRGEWSFTGDIDEFNRGIYEVHDAPYAPKWQSLVLDYRGMSGYIHRSSLCFMCVSGVHDKIEVKGEDKYFNNSLNINGFLGLHAMAAHIFFRTLELSGRVPVNRAYFVSPYSDQIIEDGNVDKSQPLDVDSKKTCAYIIFIDGNLTIDDLFISSSEMEKLKQGGSVSQTGPESLPALPDDSREREMSDPRFKWREFIRDLLHVHYGEDMAVSPWKNYSELEKDFQIKGLKPPCAKTLRRWLRGL